MGKYAKRYINDNYVQSWLVLRNRQDTAILIPI